MAITSILGPKISSASFIRKGGQESVQYDSKATQIYLTDGSLGHVPARGRKYRPTPGL